MIIQKVKKDKGFAESKLYEIRSIQKSFLHMRNGLNSFSKFVPDKVVKLLMIEGT